MACPDAAGEGEGVAGVVADIGKQNGNAISVFEKKLVGFGGAAGLKDLVPAFSQIARQMYASENIRLNQKNYRPVW
jgi:hypothetical protein